MDETILNLTQQPGELSKIHADDYYWYLTSQAFIDAFIRPLGAIVDELGGPVLDVGCGEGCLVDHCTSDYMGFDGSDTAIERARRLRSRGAFHLGRLESPDFDLGHFRTIVFGGIFSVLVKPDRAVEFVTEYCRGYGAERFVVYDLERLDLTPFDEAFGPQLTFYRQSAVIDLQDVKRHRKIVAYEAPK